MEKVTFEDCLASCLHDHAYVAEFDRLHGTRIGDVRGRSLLYVVLDDDAHFGGEDDARRAIRKFVTFVHDTVWLRLDPATRAEGPLTSSVLKILEGP